MLRRYATTSGFLFLIAFSRAVPSLQAGALVY